MRSSWLLLAPLAAPLFFINPAEASVLAACCVSEPRAPSADGDPEHDRPRLLVPAEVRRPHERTLEASAEAPIPVEVPLVDAIGIPLEERPGVSEPEFVPARGRDVERPPARVDAAVPAVPVEPIPAESKKHDGRALEAPAEVPIPAQPRRVNAVGTALGERRGVSYYASTRADDLPPWLRALPSDAGLLLALFVTLLAAGHGLSRRRRQPPESEVAPARQRPFPDELTRHLARPLPLFEPVAAPRRAPAEAPTRELEPA